MKLAVLEEKAGFVELNTRLRSEPLEVVAVEPDDPLRGDEWLGLVVSQEEQGATRLVSTALAAGHRVLLGGVPRADHVRWDEIVLPARDVLTVSRPLRFERHIARTKDVIREGTIGVPRTLELCWGFDRRCDPIVKATELIDVACFLLADEPAAI